MTAREGRSCHAGKHVKLLLHMALRGAGMNIISVNFGQPDERYSLSRARLRAVRATEWLTLAIIAAASLWTAVSSFHIATGRDVHFFVFSLERAPDLSRKATLLAILRMWLDTGFSVGLLWQVRALLCDFRGPGELLKGRLSERVAFLGWLLTGYAVSGALLDIFPILALSGLALLGDLAGQLYIVRQFDFQLVGIGIVLLLVRRALDRLSAAYDDTQFLV